MNCISVTYATVALVLIVSCKNNFEKENTQRRRRADVDAPSRSWLQPRYKDKRVDFVPDERALNITNVRLVYLNAFYKL